MATNFTEFSVYAAFGCGLVFLWRHCNTLCTSGFMDDIMFSMVACYLHSSTVHANTTAAWYCLHLFLDDGECQD